MRKRSGPAEWLGSEATDSPPPPVGKKDFAAPCEALEFSLSDPRSHAEFLTGLDMMGLRVPLADL